MAHLIEPQLRLREERNHASREAGMLGMSVPHVAYNPALHRRAPSWYAGSAFAIFLALRVVDYFDGQTLNSTRGCAALIVAPAPVPPKPRSVAKRASALDEGQARP